MRDRHAVAQDREMIGRNAASVRNRKVCNMGYLDHEIERNRRKSSSFARTLVRVLEILAIFLSFLNCSRIARFLSAKITMDVLVEVTDKFGASAGHFLSTVIAAIVAEPLIIAYVVTGLIVLINLLVMLVRKIRRRRRRAGADLKC